jgi:S-methylmethionine-dependent homocysteine/selenocysteine methylase
MALYRSALPQMNGRIFLTDGGLETTLVFLEGVELPAFAAFPLIEEQEGRERLKRYFEPYLATARDRNVGFVLDTPTWRANTDWGRKLGYSPERLATINRRSVDFAAGLRETAGASAPIVVNGVIGPRGDGYQVGTAMTAEEARSYHEAQVVGFERSAADMVTAVTMTYVEEAVGIAEAAKEHGLPAAISFTVETDGRLPSGDSLKEAIRAVDRATGDYPAYYMINCAHPRHFEGVLAGAEPWLDRIRGIRANASTRSHAELDEARDLDAGDPVQLGRDYRGLRGRLRHLSVMGGCCGTDHRHIAAICEACMQP